MSASDFPTPAPSGIDWHQGASETDGRLSGELKRGEISAILKAPPSEGIEGWLYRNLRINLGVSQGEMDRRQEQVEALKRDRGNIARIGRELLRTNGFAGFISVMSEKGGVGKTTLVALLAYVLNEIRRERIVVADLNPDKGSLHKRMGVARRHSLRDLVDAYGDILAGRAQARDFLSTTPGAPISVLSGDPRGEKRDKTSEEDVIKIFQLLSPMCDLAILDNGTGITHSALTGSLQVSHSMVMIMENTLDAEEFIEESLAFLQEENHDDLRNRLILVINDKAAITADESSSMINDLVSKFGYQVRSIVVIPFDRGIARSGPIDFSQIDTETVRALRHLAALLIDDMIR